MNLGGLYDEASCSSKEKLRIQSIKRLKIKKFGLICDSSHGVLGAIFGHRYQM